MLKIELLGTCQLTFVATCIVGESVCSAEQISVTEIYEW